MKKMLLSIFILGSFGLYVIFLTPNPASVAYIVPETNTSSATSSKNTASPRPAANTTTTASTSTASVSTSVAAGQYVDGNYVGSSADAYYGNVQVEAVISGGKITDVKFLNYPDDRSTSIRINSRAVPELVQEAISAQSAKVNGVSGASDTSAAFKQSLAVALAQATA